MNYKPLFSFSGQQNFSSLIGNRLNPISIAGLVLISYFSYGGRATAQEYPGCFLENTEGEVVFLPEVCQYPEPEPLPEIGTNVPAEGGVYQARILRRLNNTIPVIEAVFNNQQSFEMLLDTGASNTVITPIMAEFLGVVPAGTQTANTPSARGVELDVGLVQSINVAGAVTDNIAVAIAPALDIGLLGQDFFGQYDVTIKENVVEFRERSASPQRIQTTPNQQSEPIGEPSQPFENRPVGEPTEEFESEPVGEPTEEFESEPSTSSDSPTTQPSNSSDSPTTQPSNSSDSPTTQPSNSSESSSGGSSTSESSN